MSNETTPSPLSATGVEVRKTTTGWLRPFANFRRSSWVRVLDRSRKTIIAGFPPNESWLNAFAVANGYDLEVGVEDLEVPSQNALVNHLVGKVLKPIWQSR